ncbi:MAG: hypothetical protein E7B00_22205, partial [Citrobacter koseri]|nr:hypothetical protein [Citrobacter koseri]
DNPESWGGKQNPLTLPTTRSSDKAQKSSATVKISAVRFLCYKSLSGSIRTEYISSNPGLHLQPVKGRLPAYLLQQSGEQTSTPP